MPSVDVRPLHMGDAVVEGKTYPYFAYVLVHHGLFGTLGAVRTEHGVDVTLRYAFPATGMGVEPLGTLLMLVISTASQLRGELVVQA